MPDEPLRGFPDVVQLLLDDLVKFVGTDHTGYVTPEDLKSMLPFIRVRRVPGSPRDRHYDYPVVDLDFFSDGYVSALQLAERVDAYLRQQGAPPLPLVDRIEGSGPAELPYDDSGDIRRWGATYTFVTRRRCLL